MSDMKSKALPEGVSEEDVAKLVRKHGQVYPLTVRRDKASYTGLFRKPTLADMSAAASVGTDNPMAAGELLYNSCKLAVDPAMDNDDEVKVAAINGVGKLFRILEAEVGEPFGGGQ